MSDPNIDLPEGQIRFIDQYEPGLKAGTYTIKVSQTVSAPGASVPDLPQQFVVSGPRFVIDPAELHAEFPPNGTCSQFAEVLPHVVLNKRLLPWERDVPGFGDAVPWLALLVFQNGELIGDETDSRTVIANFARTMTVGQLLGSASATVRTPQLDPQTLSTDERSMSCQVITMSSATFAQIVPTARELPHLAHARQVDTSDKVLLDMQDDGVFSVVVANRFPLPGDATNGAKSIVHLVSLEGFGDLISGKTPVQPTQAQVMMVSLLSWSFSCMADPGQKFSGLVQNLAYDTNGALRPAASLMLRLPFTQSSATDPATVSAQQRLTDGYAALGYHAQTGEDNFAWYRGPLAPVVPNAVPRTGAFETSAAAMIYDKTNGVFDHSLAAAWQCGRSLALADQTYATTLMRLRQDTSDYLDQVSLQGTATPAPSDQLAQVQLAALFSGGALKTIQQVSVADTIPTPTPMLQAPAAPEPAPVDQMRSLMSTAEVQTGVDQQTSADPDAVAVSNWLGRLQLLYGVPFVHLVADARMLPAESIRFFYLDPNWINALTDGALCIGLGTSKESAVQASLTNQLEAMAATAALVYRANSLGQPPPAPATGPSGGFLIRSALIQGWPGLVVTATNAGIDVALLRSDHLASDVLFCLFNGVPDTITLAEPHEGLEFGVDDNGRVTTRVVTPPKITDGQAVTIYNPQNPAASLPTMRAAGMRVLNLNSDPNYPTSAAPANPTDVLGSLAKTLNKGTGSIGPADFAVQMVKGPEELTFSFNPPVKP
jgi:hypothetical protein